MNDLKVGDVVKLNSGGPKMTIYKIEAHLASCHWFDKNDIHQSSKFNLKALINQEEKSIEKSSGGSGVGNGNG